MNPDEQRDTIEQIRQSLTGAPPHVLLVEDSEHDARLAKRVLESQGVVVSWAQTIETATELFDSSEDFRLVFLDLRLGGQDGTNLIHHLRSSNPDAWIVVLSGVYAEDSAECKQALREGACAVMLKPLTPEKVKLIFGTP